MNPPPILFLNGTSSSGKTSMAKAFQHVWPQPVIYASNDAFIYMFADHVLNKKENLPKVIGPILTAFYRSLPHIAACGFPMIVDSVIEGEEWMRQCVEALAGYDVLFVGVKCPLEELERRELARGDRHVGFARWQYERVHAFGPYDFELDTSISSPQQCAGQLAGLLRSGRKGAAFARLRRRFESEKIPGQD
jgi:chloramphenicol 3-O phosphotransferase